MSSSHFSGAGGGGLSGSVAYAPWLSALLEVIDIRGWHEIVVKQQTSATSNVTLAKAHIDFDVRTRLLDLLLCLCLKSTSILEQHAAAFGRHSRGSYAGFAGGAEYDRFPFSECRC